MSFFLEKEKTSSTPYVLIDESKNYMKFEGMSFHENTAEFFRDIVEWLRGYLSSDYSSFTFDSKMEYFNSSTIKILYDMFDAMNDSAGSGKTITVNWYVDEDDELLIELCEDIEEDYENLTINMIMA